MKNTCLRFLEIYCETLNSLSFERNLGWTDPINYPPLVAVQDVGVWYVLVMPRGIIISIML